MKADCSVCSLTWNVSNTEEVKQRISEGKYICPYYISKRRARGDGSLHIGLEQKHLYLIVKQIRGIAMQEIKS